MLETNTRRMTCPLLQGNCVGKNCMMWVWEVFPKNDKIHPLVPPIMEQSDKYGHCGLKNG